jgi:MFS family permease
LRTPILMTLVIGTLAYENQIALPLLAKFTFGGNAGSYGFLSSSLGLGSVLGGLLVARSGRATHRRLGVAALFLGVSMLIASAMPSMGTMVAALVVVGAGSVAFITMTSATLQLTAPADMRGRVLALYVTAIIGTTPFGGPIIGWIGEVVGARATYVVGGLSCLVTVAVAWRSLSRSTEAFVSDEEAAEIERRAVREAEEVEADSASAMPVNLSPNEG